MESKFKLEEWHVQPIVTNVESVSGEFGSLQMVTLDNGCRTTVDPKLNLKEGDKVKAFTTGDGKHKVVIIAPLII